VDAAVVNYGKVFLELIGVTCIAGLILVIQGKKAQENERRKKIRNHAFSWKEADRLRRAMQRG
jgi:hypothetical protein